MSGLTIPSLSGIGHETVTPANVVAAPASEAPNGAHAGISASTPVTPADPRHQARIQALTRQVQSGNYAPAPADIAAAWLKTVG